MSDTLGNKALSIVRPLGTDDSTESPPSKPGELSGRQEAFCRLYAECGIATHAYEAAYLTSSRSVARAAAARLLRNPKVTARVRELQDAAAGRSLRSTAALIAELEEMVDADPNELCSLTVGACRYCWSDPPGSYHWRDEAELARAADAWLASLGTPKPLPSPDTKGGFGYRPDRDANPECSACNGQGIPRVIFNSTTDVSRGARRLLRGIELFPDGSVKRVLLHDQTQLRIELHKLRGLHVDRSLNLNANIDLPTPQNVSAQDVLDLWKSTR